MKTALFRIVLIQSFLCPVINAKGQQFLWEVRSDMPEGRWGASTFVIGNIAYVVGGRIGSSDRTEMWAYDLGSDSWTTLAPIPVGRRLAAAFAVHGKGYVSCGLTGVGTRLNDLWEYDPSSDTWSSRAEFPGEARYGTYHFALNGLGYVGAGNMGTSNGPFLADAFKYDPLSDSWSTATALPDAARHGTASFTLNGEAYVFGGKEANLAFSPDLWRYNATSESWTLLAPFPGMPRSSPLAFVYNSDAVIGCGRNDNTNFFDVWLYDPPTNQWSTVPTYPGESSLAGTSFSISGRAFGGLGWLLSDNTSKEDLWELVKPSKTGIDDRISMVHSVRVFPSPTPRHTPVLFSSDSNDRVDVLVHDMKGVLVASFNFLHSHTFEAGDLASGSYTIRWNTAGQIGQQSLMVLSD